MIWAIYLAAGQSKRMGRSKLTLTLGKKPLGSIALETAIHSALDGIVIVTQKDDPLDWIPPSFFIQPHFEKWIHAPCELSTKGQAESIKCGLRTAYEMGAEAIMILLADQPFVTVRMINQIISLYHKVQTKENVKYITASYTGIARPPVLFDSCLYPELLKLQGDEGARRLIRNGRERGGLVIEYKDIEHFIDIDTPLDYQTILETQEEA